MVLTILINILLEEMAFSLTLQEMVFSHLVKEMVLVLMLMMEMVCILLMVDLAEFEEEEEFKEENMEVEDHHNLYMNIKKIKYHREPSSY